MAPHISSTALMDFKRKYQRRASVLAILCATAWGQQKQSVSPFHEAESLLQQHRLAEAQTETLEQLKRHPDVDGYNLLGIIESSRNNFPAAIDAFEHALRLKPGSAKTLNNIGNAYAAQRQWAPAEREFRAALRIAPGNQDANYNLGALLLMRGDAAQAIPHLLLVPTPQGRLNLVRAYLQVHRTAEALKTADRLAQDHRSDVQIQFSLGVLLGSAQQYSAALRDLEQAAALEPNSFEVLYNLSKVLLRSGENERAELILNRASKLQPDNAEVLSLLAQSYSAQSRPLDALDVLIRAHKLAPGDVDVIFQMAQVTMSQNYFEDAIPLLESGLKIAPQRVDLLSSLGECYFMAGKPEKAIEQFKLLLAMDKSARSYGLLGLSYRNLGRFDEAKTYFHSGLSVDPHDATCLFNLGYIAERQGHGEEAERYFEDTLKYNPAYSEALLELANLRSAAKRLSEAEQLLRRYVKAAKHPADGYYKLAMVERSLHETDAANRDLNAFKTLSKSPEAGPYPFEHLFDYLDNRSQLGTGARQQLDITELEKEIQRHPNQPQNLYMLAEAYLKAGKAEDATKTIRALDALSTGDFRTLNGVGVLLARYHLYDDAIEHFQSAIRVDPGSDEAKFNLANAYFQKRQYAEALDTAGQVTEAGRKDDAYLALIGDIYAHMGETSQAARVFQDAIARNPDNDQNYLSLALIDLRSKDIGAAQEILAKGQSRLPSSGKIYWGLGLASAMAGNSDEAASRLERAVELLPEWPGGYSTLGVFYFQIGEVEKAKQVLNRFKESSAGPSLDISRIEQVLDRASATPEHRKTLSAEASQQLLQFALSLADRTL